MQWEVRPIEIFLLRKLSKMFSGIENTKGIVSKANLHFEGSLAICQDIAKPFASSYNNEKDSTPVKWFSLILLFKNEAI